MKKFKEFLNFSSYIGSHTLLYGETNTYKTYVTALFVKYLVEEREYDPLDITVLDFAPKLRHFNQMKIGGKISHYYNNVNKCNLIEFQDEIIPPRLNATNLKELMHNICANYKKTSYSIQQFNSKPTQILIINDISIHLHLGNYKDILKMVRKSNTFFGNSYNGESISTKKQFTSLLSLKEKKFVERLIETIQQSINMNEFVSNLKDLIK
ncbi:MAG: hypothetical protein GF317_19180 [Candidatus Lokiarchaeota archaeon]|nr:hypothetical protein [Candidatus Lokiarchaeota archaeon]MBD3201633.1 hypothetical protein [Candidatus Lokiarchaeota archaeon]